MEDSEMKVEDEMKIEDTDLKLSRTSTCSPRGWLRAGIVLAGLVALALGLAACGGGSPHSPGVSGSGDATTTAPVSGSSGSSGQSAASGGSLALQYSQCMRAHGVTNFPDPQGDRAPKLGPNSGIDTNSSSFQAAESACHRYTQGATLSPAELSQLQAGLVRFAQCMRSHGDTNFPDPTLDPETGVWRFFLSGHDRDTPAFQSASPACQGLMPQPPAGVSNSGG
jgi:hypothetical protein